MTKRVAAWKTIVEEQRIHQQCMCRFVATYRPSHPSHSRGAGEEEAPAAAAEEEVVDQK